MLPGLSSVATFFPMQYKVQDFDTEGQVLHPESRVWLGLSNSVVLVKC